jgi:hypothetical protein
MDMTSFSGFLSSRYSARIVVLYCSHASAGTCSREGLAIDCVRGGRGGRFPPVAANDVEEDASAGVWGLKGLDVDTSDGENVDTEVATEDEAAVAARGRGGFAGAFALGFEAGFSSRMN